MARAPTKAAKLKAEARLLSVAGAFLLAIGFPVTLALVSLALTDSSVSPFLPLVIGAPPILVGYGACHFASLRLMKAKRLNARKRPAAAAAKPRTKRRAKRELAA